jgi:hypothetical protein
MIHDFTNSQEFYPFTIKFNPISFTSTTHSISIAHSITEGTIKGTGWELTKLIVTFFGAGLLASLTYSLTYSWFKKGLIEVTSKKNIKHNIKTIEINNNKSHPQQQ